MPKSKDHLTHKPEQNEALTTENVIAMATTVAQETLSFYRRSDQYTVVQEGEQYDIQHIESGREITFQRLCFRQGKLVSVTGHDGWNNYFHHENGSIRLGKFYFSSDNSQVHTLQCEVAPDKQSLTESTRVQVSTDLGTKYIPTINKQGELGFTLSEVTLSNLHPLSLEDTVKFLPSGRFIPLQDLLRVIINPEQYDKYSRSIVPGLTQVHGFPEFNYGQEEPRTGFYISAANESFNISGFAHSLKEKPYSWLVFVHYTKDTSSDVRIARAQEVQVQASSISVTNESGGSVIYVQVVIDEETYDLSIPHKTDQEQLNREIKAGYHFDTIINAAMAAYYEKHVAVSK